MSTAQGTGTLSVKDVRPNPAKVSIVSGHLRTVEGNHAHYRIHFDTTEAALKLITDTPFDIVIDIATVRYSSFPGEPNRHGGPRPP